MKAYSSKKMKCNARAVLNRGWMGPVMVSLILVTLTLLISAVMIPFASSGSGSSWGLISGAGIEFILYLILRLFVFGADEFLLKDLRQSGPAYGDLLFAFRHQPDRFLVVSIAQVGIPAVSVLIALGFYGLLVSGASFGLPLLIIWCIAAFLLTCFFELALAPAPYLLLDNPNMSGRESLRSAKRLMRGHKKQLLVLMLSFLPWILPGIFTFGIGSLWILPYVMTSEICFYEELVYPAELPVTDNSKRP